MGLGLAKRNSESLPLLNYWQAMFDNCNMGDY